MKPTEDPADKSDVESDPRFPSGPWVGYFLQRAFPGRNMMEMHLTFRNGVIAGEGRDWVGRFVLRGRYSVENGRCHWTKQYVGKHSVFYQGYNEGKGIWGVWDLKSELLRGGFHIWPQGMAVSDDPRLSEEADVPVTVEQKAETNDPIVTTRR